MYKVSVIVPIYNTQDYLGRCLESLTNQTLNDIEILAINDGSTDESLKVLNKWALNPKIKIFSKENGGLSDARNFGINQASGEYLAFVDSDDWVELDMLEKMYNLAQKHGSKIVVCQLQKVDENDIPFRTLHQLTHYPEKIDLCNDFSAFGESSSFACNKIFHKSLWEGQKFPYKMYFEDIATIPKLVLKCETIAKTNETLYHYFERRDSMSRSYNKNGLDILTAVKLVKEEFNESKFSNQKVHWKRFVIYHAFYSFLAYWAFVKDKSLKKEMSLKMKQLLKEEDISKQEILQYSRENKNYLTSLPIKKIIFYLLYLISPKLFYL